MGKKILIVTENFYPAYKAGGPIQSLSNLIGALDGQYDFNVITSAYDMNSDLVMENIQTDEWNILGFPITKKTISVWYTERKLGFKGFRQLLKSIKPESLYLNGIFSFRFFLVPLIASKIYGHQLQLVVCPRGMLQKGALSGKSFKKTIYLTFLRLSGLLKGVHWHATNQEEKSDILKVFPGSNNIDIAMNIPKKPLQEFTVPGKSAGSLHLIYLSLIAEKKNLLFLLGIIFSSKNILLDIYGPVKDIAYWNECKILIDKMPGKVKYCGDVLPENVQKILPRYHALVLLTRGENFGHALYESLSVGRPIITSNYTPWNNLKDSYAGWNLDIKNLSGCINHFDELREMPIDEYRLYCKGAFDSAHKYYNSLEVFGSYARLFR